MFENIKLLLGSAEDDTSKDKLIKYQIQAVTKRILTRCKLKMLPSELEYIVEEIVYKKLKGKEVKREKLGDYEKEYVSANVSEDELSPYESVLKEYKDKRVKFV